MKDPAFLFYPNDYIGGTMGMTFEEKGAYVELLMVQFNRGHMTKHMITQTVGQLWESINNKFIQDENGLYYNVRLELEQNKRKSFTETRRNNKLGTNQHTKKEENNVGHMTSHMEDENEDVILKCSSKFIIPVLEEINNYCLERKNDVNAQKFLDFYTCNGWMVGKNKMKDWKAAIRTWEKENPKQKQQVQRPNAFPSLEQQMNS